MFRREINKLFLFSVKTQRVMDEAYKLLAHVYLKRLVATRLSRLRRRWQPDVGRRVTEDAELLHRFFGDLVRPALCSPWRLRCCHLLIPQLNCVLRLRQVPGVAGWNAMLLKVEDLLSVESLDVMKVTAAEMQKECHPGR